MPILICRPNGAGDFTTWTSRNVSGAPLLNWQAVSTGSPNQYVEAIGTDKRDRYTMEPLPADASTVESVTVFALCTGDELSVMALVLRLAGVQSYGALFTPPEGGYQLFSQVFATAPGGLPWTVARWNAIQCGFDSLIEGAPANNVDEFWASIVYTSALPDEDRPSVEVRLPDTTREARLPSRNAVDTALPVRINRTVRFGRD